MDITKILNIGILYLKDIIYVHQILFQLQQERACKGVS